MQSQACAENGGADGAADGTKVLWASVLRDVNVPSALSSAGLARPEGIAMQRACFTNPLGASAPWQAGQKGVPGAHHLPSANAAQRRRSHGCRTTAPRRSPSQERVVAEASIWLETPLGLGLPSAGTHETPTDRDYRGGVRADGADTRTGGGRHSEQYVTPGDRPDAPHLPRRHIERPVPNSDATPGAPRSRGGRHRLSRRRPARTWPALAGPD